MKCTSLYTKTMIMHKISYIICKKYKCRHGQTGEVAKYLYDERVDMRALETRAERCVGANPTTGT